MIISNSLNRCNEILLFFLLSLALKFVIRRSMILHFVLLNSIPFLLMHPLRFSSSFYVISSSFPVLTVPSNFASSGNFISRLPRAKIIKENVQKNLSQNRSQESFPWACAFPYKSSSLGFLTSYQIYTCWNKKPARYFTEQFNSLYFMSVVPLESFE